MTLPLWRRKAFCFYSSEPEEKRNVPVVCVCVCDICMCAQVSELLPCFHHLHRCYTYASRCKSCNKASSRPYLHVPALHIVDKHNLVPHSQKRKRRWGRAHQLTGCRLVVPYVQMHMHLGLNISPHFNADSYTIACTFKITYRCFAPTSYSWLSNPYI